MALREYYTWHCNVGMLEYHPTRVSTTGYSASLYCSSIAPRPPGREGHKCSSFIFGNVSAGDLCCDTILCSDHLARQQPWRELFRLGNDKSTIIRKSGTMSSAPPLPPLLVARRDDNDDRGTPPPPPLRGSSSAREAVLNHPGCLRSIFAFVPDSFRFVAPVSRFFRREYLARENDDRTLPL
jgi:hypothetical protein